MTNTWSITIGQKEFVLEGTVETAIIDAFSVTDSLGEGAVWGTVSGPGISRLPCKLSQLSVDDAREKMLTMVRSFQQNGSTNTVVVNNVAYAVHGSRELFADMLCEYMHDAGIAVSSVQVHLGGRRYPVSVCPITLGQLSEGVQRALSGHAPYVHLMHTRFGASATPTKRFDVLRPVRAGHGY